MSFSYQLKLSSRRKSVAIKIVKGQVNVYAPKNVDQQFLVAWLDSKASWVIEKQQESERLFQAELRQKSESFYLNGTRYSIVMASSCRTPCLCPETGTLRVSENDMLNLNTELEKIYCESLSRILDSRLKYWASRMNTHFQSVKIRYYKSRWGSCDSKGRLTFNSKLACLPESLIDYVVVHELAHRTYMNHSKAFWTLVSQYYPEHEKAKQEIRRWARLV
ncbi:M48 family metallopeptidase [Pseudoalteromonas xiamenensis]